MQATLQNPATFTGVGLHGGKPVTMVIRPSIADSGIWFNRVDVQEADPLIPARFDSVPESRLCTKISNADGISVSTIEHLMAALAGCGIHNARIDIDAEEVPILDGSAVQFVRGLLDAGIVRQDRPIYAIEILKKVTVRDGDSEASLSPASHLTMAFSIDFPDPAIGVQHRRADLGQWLFQCELCDSRTFCRQSDVEDVGRGPCPCGSTTMRLWWMAMMCFHPVVSDTPMRLRRKMLMRLAIWPWRATRSLVITRASARVMLTNRRCARVLPCPDAMHIECECDRGPVIGIVGQT